MKKRVGFDEFEVPIPKGHERITDKDDSTDYLFVTAPNDIYTLYFDSKMPLYGLHNLEGCEECSSLILKFPDRRIAFYCPYKSGVKTSTIWFFNIEFQSGNDKYFVLPGQVMLKYDAVYKKAVNGKLPFVEILEKIKLLIHESDAQTALAV